MPQGIRHHADARARAVPGGAPTPCPTLSVCAARCRGDGAGGAMPPRAVDARVALGALALLYAAFFGPGNTASVASFKITRWAASYRSKGPKPQ